MEMPIFDFDNADVKVIFEEEYACKTDTERLDKAAKFDEEMKVLMCKDSFLKAQSQERQKDIIELVSFVSRIAIVHNGKMKILLSKKLKTACIELSAPEFTFDKKGLAILIDAFFLCSDVGFYPSLEKEGDCVITFDYFFFGKENKLMDSIQKAVWKMNEYNGQK